MCVLALPVRVHLLILRAPIFAAAAVGTVSVRSLVEPLRKVAARLRGHLINARAVDLVMSERLLEVETVAPEGGKGERMYIPCVPPQSKSRSATSVDFAR